MHENRENKKERGLITVATGEYNQYIKSLIESSKKFWSCHFYLFTDQPEEYKDFKDITIIEVSHLGWPKMPLLRFELLKDNFEIFKEKRLFLIDSEAIFMRPIEPLLSDRIATLHRNILLYRNQFAYETRAESTACIAPGEGEKYYACGFVGASVREFKKMCEVIAENIRTDINNGVRALWGDESHLNRYLIDNKPTLTLPPNYMCPEGNPYFIPYIMHRNKKFKIVNLKDAKKHLEINKDDYTHNGK